KDIRLRGTPAPRVLSALEETRAAVDRGSFDAPARVGAIEWAKDLDASAQCLAVAPERDYRHRAPIARRWVDRACAGCGACAALSEVRRVRSWGLKQGRLGGCRKMWRSNAPQDRVQARDLHPLH